MYYKNISLHLAYLQTNEKKKKIAKLLFCLNKTFKSSIWLQNSISSKFFKNLRLYYIHLRDVMLKNLFIIC